MTLGKGTGFVENIEDHQQRPWAINRICFRLSLVLAILALVENLFASLYAMATGQHSRALWFLVAVWPVLYLGLYLVAYGMARVDQRGPATEQMGWLGRLCGPFRPVLDHFYHVMPNVALILFPLVFSLMSVVVVWAAVTRQLN